MTNIYGSHSMINLQATLSSATAGGNEGIPGVYPHHPITCATGELFFDEEGDFSCTHAKAPHGDKRTQACLNHSLACLIVELACQL
jgi:hypothetical protein